MTIEFIQQWAREFIALVILMGLVELLLPPDSLRNYVRMVLGLLVIVALVRPIIHELPGIKSWEPTLKTASTTGLDRILGAGSLIRERGNLAASEVIKNYMDLERALQERLPNIPINRVEKVGSRLRVALNETAPVGSEKKIIQAFAELGWDKGAIEVIRDAR